MFQFRRFPSYTYVFSIWYTVLHRMCSHIRKSADITLICSSPQLIAACHVLHRLLMPRHSPCALYSLTYSRFLVLYSWIMQAIYRLLFRKIVIVTHIFLKRCSTIKIHNFLKSLDLKNLLLPCFHHISIHCSVFKVQVPTSVEVRQKSSIFLEHFCPASKNWWR